MIRTVEFKLDTNSFGTRTVPTGLLFIPTKVEINIGVGLINVALRTRPPYRRGFDLSDTWSWLRYAPAIGVGADLRLRAEWADVDPHQKTILSDDLGMGFTTALLTAPLDIRFWANTGHYLRVVNPWALSGLSYDAWSWECQLPRGFWKD